MTFELDHVIGKDCKLYRNTGSHGTPVWDLVPRVVDVNIDGLSKTKVELPARDSNWKFKGAGMKEAGIGFGYLFTPATDPDFTAFRNSFFNDVAIELLILSGDLLTSGSQGLRAVFEVFDFPHSQELEEGQTFDVGLDIVRRTEGGVLIEPSWYVVS